MTGQPRALFAGMELPAAEAAPDWVHLVPAGLIKARDGRSFVPGDPQAVIAASSLGADLPAGYGHQIDDPAQRGAEGMARAAGWIKELEAHDDGIRGRAGWTDAARTMITAKEYRYLSPVLLHTPAEREGVRIPGAGFRGRALSTVRRCM